MVPTISHILATSSEVRLDKKVEPKDPLSHLKKGQIVEARVDQTYSSRKARLMIQGKAVSAQTHLPLQTGQQMLLRVIQAGAHPRFQMVETSRGDFLHLPSDLLQTLNRLGSDTILSRLFTPITEAGSVSGFLHDTEAFERMDRLLASISEMADQPDRHAVKSYINQSGLTWENKLVSLLNTQKPLPPALVQRLIEGDLKALSLLITQSSEEKAPLLEEIHTYLEDLESLQLLNSRVYKASGRYFIPLPILVDERIRFGQMLLDLGKDTASDAERKDQILRVSLLLEMSTLGHLQVELSILKNAITGMIDVEDTAAQARIDDQLPQLVEKLNRSGFHVEEMTCRTVAPQTLHTTSLVDRLIDDRNGVLSIVI